jgi:coenzyme F420-0:L-glutamate ligase / coenzyme F420-1:gamma-L-glutamate ligase
MPDLFDVIQQRRSIRKYRQQSVPEKVLIDILSAAGWAPSAHNAQPYGFILLENAKLRRELAEAMAEVWVSDLTQDGQTVEPDKLKERVERFANAPTLILACIIPIEGLPNYPDERRQRSLHDLAVQSLGAAIENLLLAAYAKGVGACWIAAPCFCKENVKQQLELPKDVEPQAFVMLGYPLETPVAPKKKTLDQFYFKDKWSREL